MLKEQIQMMKQQMKKIWFLQELKP
jgi:hypothetical protein